MMPDQVPEPIADCARLFLGLALLCVYLALPWLLLFHLGSLAAIAGAIASHWLYRVTLAPQGICLGMPWVAVAGNFVGVVLFSVLRLFW